MSAIISVPTGLHRDVSADTYHARVLGLASKSSLDLLHRSPAHYKAWVDGELEEPVSAALAFGSAFHCAVLEPERFAREYAVEPDFGDCRRKENREKRDAWRARYIEAIPLPAAEWNAISGMVKAVKAHPLGGKMIRDGEPELTVRWQDGETGVQCKSRVDYYVKRLRMAADIKSTLDASPAAFAKDVAKYGYHRQDAFYRSGLAAAGEPVDFFCFVAVEKSPPYAVAVHVLDAEGRERGGASIRQDLITMADCLKRNEWPGYESRIHEISIPGWAA